MKKKSPTYPPSSFKTSKTENISVSKECLYEMNDPNSPKVCFDLDDMARMIDHASIDKKTGEARLKVKSGMPFNPIKYDVHKFNSDNITLDKKTFGKLKSQYQEFITNMKKPPRIE